MLPVLYVPARTWLVIFVVPRKYFALMPGLPPVPPTVNVVAARPLFAILMYEVFFVPRVTFRVRHPERQRG